MLPTDRPLRRELASLPSLDPESADGTYTQPTTKSTDALSDNRSVTAESPDGMRTYWAMSKWALPTVASVFLPVATRTRLSLASLASNGPTVTCAPSPPPAAAERVLRRLPPPPSPPPAPSSSSRYRVTRRDMRPSAWS